MFMRTLLLLLVSSVFAAAADSVPSEASVRELLTVTDSKKTVDAMMAQMDGMIQNAVSEATKGEEVSAAEQKLVDKNVAEMKATLAETLVWEKLEPIYLRVYQKSLTQDEVNGMIAFYKTPTGQAMITKMPVVIQNTMTEVQGMMGSMMQKLQQTQQALVADLEAEKAKAEKAKDEKPKAKK